MLQMNWIAMLLETTKPSSGLDGYAMRLWAWRWVWWRTMVDFDCAGRLYDLKKRGHIWPNKKNVSGSGAFGCF